MSNKIIEVQNIRINVTSVNEKDYICILDIAKAKNSNSRATDVYSNYAPTFKCTTDGNGKGVINSKVGLITVDEVMHAGLGKSAYICSGRNYWTMSQAGLGRYPYMWLVFELCGLPFTDLTFSYSLRPVINFSAEVLATGTGTSDDPYLI